MKIPVILIFVAVVLTVHFLVNYYIFIHGWNALPVHKGIRMAYCILFGFLFISYIASRFLERAHMFSVAPVFTWTGAFWLGAMAYLFFFVALLDLVRLFEHWFHFLPAFIYTDYQKTKMFTALFAVVLVGSLLIAGYINATHPHVKKLDIAVHKKANGMKHLKIVAVSDIHMGVLFGYDRVNDMVDRINKLQPDIILFAGDIIDEVLAPVLHYNMGSPLKRLHAPLGVYAVTGNHEYIGGADEAVRYLKTLNINMLQDTSLLVANSFYIIGREDHDMFRFSGKQRKTKEELLQHIDTSLPLILLDHQPYELDKTVQNNIDLQISGHTHHGQIWPFNYITQKIFGLSWGYRHEKNSNIYVSCGYGTWGPPMRIGNRPEIVQITIDFD